MAKSNVYIQTICPYNHGGNDSQAKGFRMVFSIILNQRSVSYYDVFKFRRSIAINNDCGKSCCNIWKNERCSTVVNGERVFFRMGNFTSSSAGLPGPGCSQYVQVRCFWLLWNFHKGILKAALTNCILGWIWRPFCTFPRFKIFAFRSTLIWECTNLTIQGPNKGVITTTVQICFIHLF